MCLSGVSRFSGETDNGAYFTDQCWSGAGASYRWSRVCGRRKPEHSLVRGKAGEN